jgi:antitoxin (DNA-binding transcriptional repressor) of toxin-antitoxin stability system
MSAKTKIVNMHEAKTTLSRLVADALAGNDVVLAKAGKPMVRLVPVEQKHKPRKLGIWKGKVKLADDFDAPLPDDLLDLFYNGPIFPPETSK